jgi:protein O-mannosyl-transferase
VKGWKHKSVWAYAAAFYLITLSIVSNLVVSVGTFMNERFVYQASLGFCLALAYGFFKLGNNIRTVGLSVCAVALAVLTLIRVPAWENGQTLNEAAIKVSKNSARANLFYGISIWEKQFLPLKKDSLATPERLKTVLDSVQPYFEKAVEILPNYGSAMKMLAGAAAERHKIDGNLDVLLAAFTRVNLSNTYEPFVIQYLEYLNERTFKPEDIQKLRTFYTENLAFYKKNYANSIMPKSYEKLLQSIQNR